MKKIAVIIVVLLVLFLNGCSCDSSKLCEICHKNRETSKYTIELNGIKESGYMCKKCAKEKKVYYESMGGTVKN